MLESGDKMINKIKEEIRYIKAVKAEINKRIVEAPSGKLRCAICRGNYQYYIGNRYLKSKEKKLAIRLAEKEYSLKIEKQLGRYESALEVIEDFIENERLQNIYRELQVWNKKVTIYPDFTVLNKRTGKKWFIEHLGMMDRPNYFETSMNKLDTYEKNDILLGRDLIILHETSKSPLNTKVLEKYINEYFY